MASTAESSAPAPAPKEKDVTKELAIQARNYYNRTQVPDGVSDGKLYYSPARISGVKEALEKLNKLATESEDIKILDRHGGEMISIDEAIVSIKANLKLSEEIHLEKGYKVPEASEGAEAEESVESDAEKVEKRKDEFVQQAKEKFAKFVKLMNKLEKLPEFTEAEELKERAKKAIDTFVEKLNAISSGGSAEDLGSPVTEMQAIEQEAKKLNIDLEKGQVVSWTNEKGEKLAGFVTGLAKKGKGIMIRIGDKDHIVNRQDVKIESGSSAEIKTEVVKATSFESLKTLLPDYLTVGSKIYDKKELQDMVDLIVKSNPAIESPLVHALPKEGGFRNKVIELLQPHLLEVKRNNYADKYAKVSKKFGGVVGWIRRATNSGAYLKDMEGLQESKDTYMEARAETVAAKMEKWTSEQMALSDAKAEAFQKEKGWGSKVYDLYRNNKYIRKFNKGRLYVGLGLMGASLVAGAPVLATAGAFGGAYFAASRAFGFVGGSMGSYELMNWADKRKGTKIPLSPEIKSKLKEYKKQIKGVLANKEAAIQEQMDEYVRKNGLSRSEKSEDPGYLALANQLKERKRLIQQKTVELQAEQAIELPDDQLEKVLIYYQTVVVRNGIKISEDPKYQMLLKEKARRMKGVIDGLKAQDVSSEKAKIGAEDRERLERAVEARAEHLRELAIHRTDDYIRNVILTFVRQQELNKVKGTAAQRKKSPEYKRAQACQNVLDKRYKNLPPDIQVVLDQLSAKGTKNPAEYYQQIYTTESVKKIMKVRKHGFEEDINLFSINLEAWEMNDDFKSHLNEVLSNNELIKKQAQEDVLNDMETFVTAVAEKEKRVEAKVNALEEILAKKLNAIDERAESEALQKQWSNETRRTVRKVIAVEIGALFASGVVQRKLMGMAFGSGEAAAGEVSDTRASGGGEVVEPTPTVAEGTPGPERELVAGVDYPGEAVLPEDDAGVTGAEVETAAVKAAEVETAVVEEHPVPAVEAVLDATYPEQTFEFGDGDSVSRIMDIETMDHGQEMFPSQWEEALESAGGNETVAKESFNEFIHDWKMGQLKGLGYDWVKFDGQYHYGYPFTPHAGAELSFVQDPEAMGGWKIEMADHHLTEHDQLRFRDLPAEAWQNGSVKTVLGETIEAPKDLEVAAVEKSVELPVAEASEPVSEAPIEEPIADPDLEPEEVLAEESIVEPEEVPAEELATETEQAPAEPRMDTSNPGEVYMES
ncbi:hypothetical protein HOM83_00845, partial [Candidatus Falkowbacteria bacterium]|nr:hypothetical protein [Candidatus Falkowbacteria bacterium]